MFVYKNCYYVLDKVSQPQESLNKLRVNFYFTEDFSQTII